MVLVVTVVRYVTLGLGVGALLLVVESVTESVTGAVTASVTHRTDATTPRPLLPFRPLYPLVDSALATPAFTVAIPAPLAQALEVGMATLDIRIPMAFARCHARNCASAFSS